MKKSGAWRESIIVKTFLFLMLVLTTATVLFTGIGMLFLMDEDAYQGNSREIMERKLTEIADRELDYVRAQSRQSVETLKEMIRERYDDFNLCIVIGQETIVGTYDEDDYMVQKEMYIGPELDELCNVTVYIDNQLPKRDHYRYTYEVFQMLLPNRELFTALACGGVILFPVLLWLWLCTAGYRKGFENLTGTVVSPVWLDLHLVFWGLAGTMYAAFASQGLEWMTRKVDFGELMLFCALALIIGESMIFLLLYDLAARIKMGRWWRNTLTYKVIMFTFGLIKGTCRGVMKTFCGLAVRPKLIVGMVIWLGVEFFGLAVISAYSGRNIPGGVLAACIFEKILILFGVIYLVEKFERLQKAGEAIAEGDLEYKVDTSKMIPSLKQHGENLNRIGEGLGRAVTERMKSEHLKTELITNVSHDIKTPLTSIINYADLLGSGEVSREQAAEYSEVLLRQSRRLKKLLEDLVEASKATTGNLEVNMTACQAEVLLTQAAGEYEQRFEDKQLQLVVRKPEEEIWIRADGRHLWRVFDNLLNNICKYAQENTRVYLSLERMEGKAVITFRNTSKYQLDVSTDELMERFVRGDKSRNMEGNGLGLSIAKSLVELQKGNMEIVVDGDLFKVILTFAVTQKPEEAE